jgi:hypothetical protein
MCANRYLPCVGCSCICVAHESCHQRPEGYAPQPCPQAVAAIRSSTGCRRADAEGLRCLSSSSLSLSAAGSPLETTSSHRRYEGRFHREALARVSATRALVREHYGSLVKRDRQPGVVGGSEAEKRAWLGAAHQTATLFSWNIDSIVCSSRNWSKRINSWYPRYVDRLDQRH